MRGVGQEIRDSEGAAHLVRGPVVGDDAALLEAFNAARDDEYRKVLDRCHDFHAELEKEREALGGRRNTSRSRPRSPNVAAWAFPLSDIPCACTTRSRRTPGRSTSRCALPL
jgi:ChrB-like protein